MDFLVAYDVFDNKRRRKIQKYLYENSISYQKSAIEVVEINKRFLKEVANKVLEFSDEEDLIALFNWNEVIYIGKNEKVELVVWKK